MKCARKWRLEGCLLEPKEEERRKIHQIHVHVQAVRGCFGFFPNRTYSDHIDEEASISLKEKRNEEETQIHEVEVEYTTRFLVGDL